MPLHIVTSVPFISTLCNWIYVKSRLNYNAQLRLCFPSKSCQYEYNISALISCQARLPMDFMNVMLPEQNSTSYYKLRYHLCIYRRKLVWEPGIRSVKHCNVVLNNAAMCHFNVAWRQGYPCSTVQSASSRLRNSA